MDSVVRIVDATPLAGWFLVVALGYLAGRPKWREISLGPAGGTLLVGLVCGHFGLAGEVARAGAGDGPSIGGLGFALFIYSVGFEAGAGFFGALRTHRMWRMAAVGVSVNLVAIGASVLGARWASLDASTAAGVLAGSMTSAATFAAVSDVALDATRLSIAFALTYPFGLVGFVLLVQLVPRRVIDDLADDADRASDEHRRARSRPGAIEPEETRIYVVANEPVVGRTLRELDLTHRTGCHVTRIHRGDDILSPDADTRFEAEDRVLATGRPSELRAFEGLVGPETVDRELEERLPRPRRVEVLARQVAGRTLAELRFTERYRCLVLTIERCRERIESSAEFVLQRGDIVEVIGERRAVRALAREVGRLEPAGQETDIAAFAAGILFGLLLGAARVSVGGVEIGLGPAGGLLLIGLILGRAPRGRRFACDVPPAARQLVRDLGVLLFVAEISVPAGARVAQALATGAGATVLVGALVHAASIGCGLALARLVFRLRPIDAWGSVAGGMTSSAALVAVRSAAQGDEPAVAYAAAFAVSTVVITLGGHVVVALVG